MEERSPFYLYVDEFQNFATDSFATILSEARKYGLNLTVANQYIAQMLPEVRDAIFGNVGSVISFRTSADDARAMLKYFEPKFEEHDLVHMHNRHFVISMTIEGEKVQAFSSITLNLPQQTEDYSQQIIDHSRATYAVSKQYIERFVHERYLSPTDNYPAPQNPSPPAIAPRAEQPKPKDTAPSSVAHTALTGSIGEGSIVDKPKRKRTRKRRSSSTNLAPPQTSNIEEHTISLR